MISMFDNMQMPEYKYEGTEEAKVSNTTAKQKAPAAKPYSYQENEDALNLDSILNKYSKPSQDDDFKMMDVDEYLKKLENEEIAPDLEESVGSTIKTDDSVAQREDLARDADFRENKSTTGTLNDRTRVGSSSSSKGVGLFGAGKKNMKDFMKNALSKTKQTGNNAVFMVSSSSVGQKTKHFVPKKRKDSTKEKPGRGKNRSLVRSDSANRARRPPLKPNLKPGSKQQKAQKVPRFTPQNPTEEKPRRASINTNPFKPPLPKTPSQTKPDPSAPNQDLKNPQNQDLEPIGHLQVKNTSQILPNKQKDDKNTKENGSENGSESEEEIQSFYDPLEESQNNSAQKEQFEENEQEDGAEPKEAKKLQFEKNVEFDTVGGEQEETDGLKETEETVAKTSEKESQDLEESREVEMFDSRPETAQEEASEGEDEAEDELEAENQDERQDATVEARTQPQETEEKEEKEKYHNPLMTRLENMMNQPEPEPEEEPLPDSENLKRTEQLSNQLDDIMNRPKENELTPQKANSEVCPSIELKDDESVRGGSQTEVKSKVQKSKSDAQGGSTKPPVPRQPKLKKKKVKKAKVQEPDDDVIDYSHVYNNFYEIFNNFIQHPKNFDPSATLREVRNLYSTYISLMDSNILFAAPQFKFEAAPLEKSYYDYAGNNSNHYVMTGKKFNDMELEAKNRDNDLLKQAYTQAQLKQRYQKLKKMNEEAIVQENIEKIKQELKKNKLIDIDKEPSLFFRVVKNKSEVYDIITRAFSRKKCWNELPHGLDLRNSWNFMWSWSKIRIDISKLLVWQRCNHFPQARQMCRKDFLKKNLERAVRVSQGNKRHFNILPETYVLPKEYVTFIESFLECEEKEGKQNYWIIKPAAKSRGRGINVINDVTQITYGEPIVVQKYLKNPMLLNGFKFDLRIYVLATSFNPLEAFIYKEGFARMSTTPFSLDPEQMANKFVHLTNYSIQKKSQNKDVCDEIDSVYGGTKISLTSLKKYFKEKDIDYDDMWEQTKQVVLKSLIACQNEIPYNPCCFELYGYDVIIDDNGKVWLIEVNSSPSLARDHLLDDIIKQRLIDDTIDLVDPIDFDRKRLFEVLERRITQDIKQNTSANGTNASSKHIMNRDLTYILNGAVPRAYGEDPKLMGNFEKIAPTKLSEKYIKMMGGQKMFGSMMKVNRAKSGQDSETESQKGQA